MMKQYEVLQKYLDGVSPLKIKQYDPPKRSRKASNSPKISSPAIEYQPLAAPQTAEKNSPSILS